MEAEIKDKKDWLHYQSIPLIKQLAEAEPGNNSNLFDMGQNYSVLKQTHNALAAYGQDLIIDPGDYASRMASEAPGPRVAAAGPAQL